MSVELLTSHSNRLPLRLRGRARQRRRLAAQDRVSAQLAELHQIRLILAGASALVSTGWVQNGWFSYRDEQGRQCVVDAHNLHRLAGRPISGACLVGAIVQAGGGLPAARSQAVQRSLDLTWQVLYHGAKAPLDFCPAPAVRAARVRDLTAWNDRPHRNVQDVMTLLDAVDRAAAARPKAAQPT
jgi:hypothetical protein